MKIHQDHGDVGNITRDGEHTVIRIKGKGNETHRGVLPPLAVTPGNTWIEQAEIIQDRVDRFLGPLNHLVVGGRTDLANRGVIWGTPYLSTFARRYSKILRQN